MHRRTATRVESIDDPHPRRYSPASVRFLLVMLAIVPLVGAAWFASRELTRTADGRAKSEQVTGLARDHVELARLRSLLLDEHNWVVMTDGLDQLGIPPSLVRQLTGIDTDAELSRAQALVDTQLASVDLDGVREQVTTVRNEPDPILETRDSYLDLERIVAASGDLVFRELLEVAGDIDGGGDLVMSLRVLDAATEARHEVASQLTTFFAVQFPDPGSASWNARLLVGQQVLYERAIGELDAVVPGSATERAMTGVEESVDVAVFSAAIDRSVSALAEGGDQNAEFSAAAVFADVDQVIAVFTSGTSSVSAHVELVDGAVLDVTTTSQQINEAAEGASRRSAAMLAALTVASLAIAIAVSHSIAAPLRRLADRAQALRQAGELSDQRLRGPREVRQVAGAIDEAAAHIALAERQARALAEGNLAHPALGESAPGELGASLQHAVRTLAVSLDEREEFRQRLAHEAAHDGLTSLANRTSSLEQLRRGLARTRRDSAALAVMFVDLDDFKDVNDGHGHLVGDAVLRRTAQRLRGSVREGDHVGRLGGDEFIVIAEPVHDVAEAMTIAHRVRDNLSAPILVDGTTVQITACIGVALANQDSDLTADEFLRDADLAVYKAKSIDSGQVELCDVTLKNEVLQNDHLERGLRSAIDASEFVLHYQPIVATDSGAALAVEALVRWHRPAIGLVGPPEFIPFAERSDLIIGIDRWVIDRSVRQLGAWSDDEELRHLAIAVNISARHFESDHVVDNILEPLTRHGVDPRRLVIEVTESALLVDLDNAARKLQSLRDAGVVVALDDFGTGYTSLAYLRSLPFDIIKIDRSFIDDEGALSFVKLIIDTGHLIGARITAEGIETRNQADLLTDLGCDNLQGYYFGRPDPNPASFEWIRGPTRPVGAS